ncbi:hypothetical protein A2X44_04570 [candidate division CPR3 bacterium GWF2_35_18]|uniref:Uncharacterized protein n=1 Tax=candidate division CPR3 bacterium GW2011_GWF2_35_18 TaxID=1618350 RepID=A0A0G0EPY8_UNCC3|nr:MAG: hypothetical protein UR67_C0007G0102 [candidate division CPR3 bacterium GW2011_GWF2_35_18]KKP85245.1 MAG: hypothetical protein UR87_C0057G0007 [candidate division CPR3 bacterium GW2011_GWE2_35_7]OGB62626.1 MAG: hypothetical protein A2X44_04570 [candidate division CPR3 bacterium GWF2_35_18]OGB65876.1 MAG: hypothetical protein A2250_01820 [candidate division CPR3 bacterium RIFOXYA2_FULL_35_13]OGB76768.1 MAG: hypothetical protein A2476_01375 [candidate division CPR3 bacterium RIFOXYC2_FULL
MKKNIIIGSIFLIVIVIGGIILYQGVLNKSPKDNSPEINTVTNSTNSEVTKSADQTKEANSLCDWVDESDIIIKLTFADGVTKDTSYEAGFAFDSITRTARLARSACDYRTGFSYAELKNKGSVQVAVWGYSDSRRRQLKSEPVTVFLDSQGKPNIGSTIEVEVID